MYLPLPYQATAGTWYGRFYSLGKNTIPCSAVVRETVNPGLPYQATTETWYESKSSLAKNTMTRPAVVRKPVNPGLPYQAATETWYESKSTLAKNTIPRSAVVREPVNPGLPYQAATETWYESRSSLAKNTIPCPTVVRNLLNPYKKYHGKGRGTLNSLYVALYSTYPLSSGFYSIDFFSSPASKMMDATFHLSPILTNQSGCSTSESNFCPFHELTKL